MSSIAMTCEKIILAAGPVFATKGFQAATVREICQSADVNLASVNYHFGDKKQLYLETVRRAQQILVAEVPIPARPAGTPPETRLRDFVGAMCQRMFGREDSSWQAQLMLNEVLNPTEACAALAQEYFRPHLERLLAIIADLVPEDTPAWQRRQMAFSVIGQCLFYRVSGAVVTMIVDSEEIDSRFRIDQIADHVTSFSLAAISTTCSAGTFEEVGKQ